MSTGPKRNWGGKREGAGRPKETLSVAQVRAMLDKAEQWAKKNGGKTIDDILMAVIYADSEFLGETVTIKDRMAAIKLSKDKTMATITEGGEADEQLGPGVYLPDQRPDPAKVVNGDFGKK